ncbi:hypothetical protein SEA_CREWMATE_63 [Arthrobacter phage Crewmate]|uniref:Uncharacterized protein n=1 Tax=Arthrobacter phage Crewmate TaxID=2832317 RepID=A0AA48Y3P1_9CAUD|nr:hypothetical protein PQE17_gp63 [Arthrobacter phage Crewmate]UIW13314.1 hypothetical protein SEA_CREWMATE_63 [Arthrobacter phage Crewmate]
MDNEELTYKSADGETYKITLPAEGDVYATFSVHSSTDPDEVHVDVVFFPDELDDVAALFARAAKAHAAS